MIIANTMVRALAIALALMPFAACTPSAQNGSESQTATPSNNAPTARAEEQPEPVVEDQPAHLSEVQPAGVPTGVVEECPAAAPAGYQRCPNAGVHCFIASGGSCSCNDSDGNGAPFWSCHLHDTPGQPATP